MFFRHDAFAAMIVCHASLQRAFRAAADYFHAAACAATAMTLLTAV